MFRSRNWTLTMMSSKKMLICLWLCFLGVSYVFAQQPMPVYDDRQWLPSIGIACLILYLLGNAPLRHMIPAEYRRHIPSRVGIRWALKEFDTADMAALVKTSYEQMTHVLTTYHTNAVKQDMQPIKVMQNIVPNGDDFALRTQNSNYAKQLADRINNWEVIGDNIEKALPTNHMVVVLENHLAIRVNPTILPMNGGTEIMHRTKGHSLASFNAATTSFIGMRKNVATRKSPNVAFIIRPTDMDIFYTIILAADLNGKKYIAIGTSGSEPDSVQISSLDPNKLSLVREWQDDQRTESFSLLSGAGIRIDVAMSRVGSEERYHAAIALYHHNHYGVGPVLPMNRKYLDINLRWQDESKQILKRSSLDKGLIQGVITQQTEAKAGLTTLEQYLQSNAADLDTALAERYENILSLCEEQNKGTRSPPTIFSKLGMPQRMHTTRNPGGPIVHMIYETSEEQFDFQFTEVIGEVKGEFNSHGCRRWKYE